MLTIGWDNNMTAEARLSDEQKENGIFPGSFVLDKESEVLVTGCEDEDQLSVQFHSQIFGSRIFAVSKKGTIVDEKFQENGTDDYEDDDLLCTDNDSLPDLDDYKVNKFDYPSKVELHLN